MAARHASCRYVLISTVATVSVACGAAPVAGRASAEPVAAPAGVVDPVLQRPDGLTGTEAFAFDGMASGLTGAADALARGEDPTLQCVGVLVFAERPEGAAMPDAAAKAAEQCGREIPLVWADRQLDIVEGRDDLAASIGECARAQVALDQVRQRFTDPRVDELQARSDRARRG